MPPFYCFENYLAINIQVFYTDPGLFVCLFLINLAPVHFQYFHFPV